MSALDLVASVSFADHVGALMSVSAVLIGFNALFRGLVHIYQHLTGGSF